MENLTLDEIKRLATQKQDPVVSIYMPTHRAGQDTYQDPIRYKNLLKDAEQLLEHRGMSRRDVENFMKPAQDLLNESFFWEHQRDGLVVFTGPDSFDYFQLPFQVKAQVVAAQAHYMKPVLPLFTNNGHYYILAFSQKEVRFFEGTRHTVGQIDLPEGTPTSLEEALRFDDPEKELQFHTGTSQEAGQRDGMFHGHGGAPEEHKDRIERYLNLLDHGLKPVYRESRTPWVLAGVDYLHPIYRKVSEYQHILEDGITGNTDHMRAEDLHEQAWPLVAPHFRRQLDEVIDRYHALRGENRSTDDIETILAAALYGRVESLVLASDVHLWGAFDHASGELLHQQEEQSDHDDLALLDFAAMQTLQNGGQVYAIRHEDMPDAALALAVLRY